MRKTILIFIALLPVLAYSQNKSKYVEESHEESPVEALLIAYADSLATYKHHLDSLEQLADSLKNITATDDDEPASRYMRLFMPMTFYPQLAHRHFSIDADDSWLANDQMSIDNALMNIYINHPELVSKGSILTPATSMKEIDVKEEKIKNVSEVAVVEAPKAEEMIVEPIQMVIKKPNFWTFSGDNYLQIMQNYYSANWYQGGESNYSVLGKVTLRANYNNKQKVKFENTLEMILGFQTNKSDTVHGVKTSSDLLRYTGKLGLQATKKWYYTLQVVASSQFMRSFASNSYNVNSDFLSPFVVNVSLGMDYTMNWLKGKLTGSVHLAPFAFNYKYVDRLALSRRNGIEEGKHHLSDYGSTFTVDCNWKISDNVNWRTRLYGYTTYKRVELQWENTFNLKISRYLSANVYLYPRFDDSNPSRYDEDFGYFQLKEYTSLGLSYSF